LRGPAFFPEQKRLAGQGSAATICCEKCVPSRIASLLILLIRHTPTITYSTRFSSSSLKNSLKSLGRVVIVALPHLFDGRQPLCWRLRLPVRPVVGLIGQRGHRKGRSIQRRGSVRSMSAPVGLHGIGGALSPYPFVPTVFRTGGTIIPNCTLPTRPPLRRERIFPEQGPPKLPVALEARQVVRGLVHELDAAVANVLTGVSYAAPAATAAPVEHLPVSTAHPNHHGNAARNTRRTRWNALKTPSNLSKSGSPPISRNLRCRYRAPCARRKPGSIVAPRTSSYPKQPAPFQCARAGRAKEMKVRLECLPVTGFPDPAGERCGGLNPPSSR